MRNTSFKKGLTILSSALALLASSYAHSDTPPKRELLRIPQAAMQPLEAGKVNIMEFFSYYCIHCYRLSPYMSEFIEKNKDKISYKQVHVYFSPAMDSAVRMHQTLDKMGYMPQMSSKIFEAVQQKRDIFDNSTQRDKFLEENDIDISSYNEHYNSFATRVDVDRAKEMMRDYHITSTPTIIVNNQYIHSPAINNGYKQTVDALNYYLTDQPSPVAPERLVEIKPEQEKDAATSADDSTQQD